MSRLDVVGQKWGVPSYLSVELMAAQDGNFPVHWKEAKAGMREKGGSEDEKGSDKNLSRQLTVVH